MTAELVRCQQVVELLADYLDGALEEPLAARVAAHLDGCDACTEFLVQLQATAELVGRLPDAAQLDPQVRSLLLREFRGVLG